MDLKLLPAANIGIGGEMPLMILLYMRFEWRNYGNSSPATAPSLRA